MISPLAPPFLGDSGSPEPPRCPQCKQALPQEDDGLSGWQCLLGFLAMFLAFAFVIDCICWMADQSMGIRVTLLNWIVNQLIWFLELLHHLW
jgi:hypothetical protein